MNDEPVSPALMFGRLQSAGATLEHGRHLGEWPTCERLRASIRHSNAEGYPTTLASTYARLAEGPEPCQAVEELCDLA